MRTFRDAKIMAKALREALDRRQVALSHSECLEIVAQQFGLGNWNVLAAQINAVPSAVRLQPAVPILRIFSVDKAKEFYLDFLGFTLDWEHRFEPELPLYAQVSRSELTMHLSEHHGDASPGSTVYVRISGIDKLHRELIGKDYPYARPGIEDTPWGTRTLCVADPFGNNLRFNEPQTAASH